MFYINVWLTVKESANAPQVKSLLSEAAKLSREEPDCVRFEVYHSETDPSRFLLAERWESREAWEEHKTRKAFVEIYQPQVLPLVDREAHISSLLD